LNLVPKEENALIKNMNKLEMNKLAEKHGLLVPKSFVINLVEVENIEKRIDEFDISYPCIIKPLQSIDGTKSDISICSNSRLLKENLEKLGYQVHALAKITEIIVSLKANKRISKGQADNVLDYIKQFKSE